MRCRYETWHYTSGIFGVVTQRTTASDFGGVRSRTKLKRFTHSQWNTTDDFHGDFCTSLTGIPQKQVKETGGDGREHKRNNGANGNYVYTVF